MPTSSTEAEGNYSIASLMLKQNKQEAAEQHARKAIDLDPEFGEAWFLLGHILGTTNRLAEAEEAFRRSVPLLPESTDPVLGLAHTLRAQGKLEAAMPLYQQARNFYQSAVQTQPENAAAHRTLGEIYIIENNFAAAESGFRTALQYEPDNLETLLRLADTLFFQGKASEMTFICETALRLAPDGEWTNIKMAEALNLAAKPDPALAYIEKALANNPRNIRAITLSAIILERLGETQKGYERLLPLIENGNVDDVNVVLTYATLARHTGKYDEAISLLRNVLEKGLITNNAVRLMAHFSLGDLYDHLKLYDAAFEHYKSGNQLKQISFNKQQFSNFFNKLETTFTRSFLDSLPHASKNSELPIFVVGMPRSGTTLVETILASHPDIHGAGELGDITEISRSLGKRLGNQLAFPENIQGMTTGSANTISDGYINTLKSIAGEAKRVVDKFPSNFLYLGLIQVLFPGARIIHCRRDPLDTCLSCYFKNFVGPHPYAYNLETLGFFYSKYQHLMAHWHQILSTPIYDVDYENLVNHQEETSRQLISFCELEWDDACLQFHEHDRFAATASYDQVRQPIYNTSVKRWKNYEKFISPLADALGMK